MTDEGPIHVERPAYPACPFLKREKEPNGKVKELKPWPVDKDGIGPRKKVGR